MVAQMDSHTTTLLVLLRTCMLATIVYGAIRLMQLLAWCRQFDLAWKDIPSLEKHWFFGSILQMRREGSLQCRTRLFNETGSEFIKFYLGPLPVLLSRSAGFFQHFYLKNGSNYLRPKVPVFNRLATTGLVNSEGANWHHNRKVLQALFTPKALMGTHYIIEAHCRRLVALWNRKIEASEDGLIDTIVDHYFATFGCGVIAAFAFSSNIDALVDDNSSPLADSFSAEFFESIEAMMKIPVSFQGLPSPARWKFDRAVAKADEALMEIIRRRRKESLGEGAPAFKHQDMLDVLMNPSLDRPYTDKEIRDQCMLFYWAGQETMAESLTWTTYFLAKYPDVQQRLFEEVVRVVGVDGELSAAKLATIPYLDNCFNESLRLRSPGPSTLRIAAQDDEFGGVRIPKGAWVQTSLMHMHIHPKHWENPLQFDPDRFQTAPAAFTFLPFITGAKTCIGQRMAKMEARSVLAAVVRQFHLELVPGWNPGMNSILTLRPVNGVRLLIRKRCFADTA